MLHITNSVKAELPFLYKLERLCYTDPWTFGILRDCFDVDCLFYSFYCCKSSYKCLENVVTQISLPSLADKASCDKPIGFMINQIILDECHLLNFCIHPDFQNLGLGQRILEWFIESMRKRGIHSMFLEVRVSNVSAIKIYQKMGFKKIRIRKKYYVSEHGQEDALVMKLEL